MSGDIEKQNKSQYSSILKLNYSCDFVDIYILFRIEAFIHFSNFPWITNQSGLATCATQSAHLFICFFQHFQLLSIIKRLIYNQETITARILNLYFFNIKWSVPPLERSIFDIKIFNHENSRGKWSQMEQEKDHAISKHWPLILLKKIQSQFKTLTHHLRGGQ